MTCIGQKNITGCSASASGQASLEMCKSSCLQSQTCKTFDYNEKNQQCQTCPSAHTVVQTIGSKYNTIYCFKHKYVVFSKGKGGCESFMAGQTKLQ